MRRFLKYLLAGGLLVTLDGIPIGEFRPSCDVRDLQCKAIPSGQIAGAIGMDRDCGHVNAVGLAECLDLEVIPHPEGDRLILRTRKGGWRTPEWECYLRPQGPRCKKD